MCVGGGGVCGCVWVVEAPNVRVVAWVVGAPDVREVAWVVGAPDVRGGECVRVVCSWY